MAEPVITATSVDVKNISNIFRTVDALFREYNDIGGKISNIGQTLRVLLCLARLPFDEKEYLIGGEESEDEVEDDEEDEEENEEEADEAVGSDEAAHNGDREEVGNGKRKSDAVVVTPDTSTSTDADDERPVKKNRVEDSDVSRGNL